MRPTFSIICFTVLSGAGYGAWFLAAFAFGLISPAPTITPNEMQLAIIAVVGLVLGFVLVSAGLLASLGHLGQPQRAWRALSQWRSSWLSREGIAALATYLPALALLVLAFCADGLSSTGLRAGAFALALGAFATVYCTAHIYSCLKPIRAWHDPHVVPGYLLLALHSGALLLWALASLSAIVYGWIADVLSFVVIATATSAGLLKSLYWRSIDRLPTLGAAHATGLESLGSVRSFEQPHTEENYLTHEMGFVLARKHARKLRAIAMLLGFLVPGVLAALALAMPAASMVARWVSLIAGMTGIFVERWLFFAEAKHAVMAYYAR